MPEQVLRVETYSGYKADQRPLRLHLSDRTLEVAVVEDAGTRQAKPTSAS